MKSVITKLRRAWNAQVAISDPSWQDLEHFDEGWKQRINAMAGFITAGESVLDLGCGKMWLKPLLKGVTYVPVDYRSRGMGTVIADFNEHEFPDIAADTAFVSGAMEYVTDCEWFVRQIAAHSKKCILSYCTMECYPNMDARLRNAWKSHLSSTELVSMFARNAMDLAAECSVIALNPIFVFKAQFKDVNLG